MSTSERGSDVPLFESHPKMSMENQIKQAAALRKRAESVLAATVPPVNRANLSPEELQNTLHDLQVHQVELTLQNEELRRTQVELDVSRSRYFDFFDLAPVGYVTLSAQGLILEANLTTASLLGVARSVLVSQPITRFILQEDQDRYYLYSKKLLQTNVSQECDVQMISKDAALVWVRLRGLAGHTADGTPVFRVVLSDISEHKRTEEQLLATNRLLGFFIDQAPASLAMFDTEMRYLRASRQWLNDYGLGDRDLTGLSHYDVFPEIPPEWRQAHQRGLAGEQLRAEADCFKRADGSEQWIRWEIMPWFDDAGIIGGIVILTEDISEHKRAREALLATEKALREGDERLKFSLESCHIGAWDLNLEDHTAYRSQEHKNIFGYPDQHCQWTLAMFIDHVLPEDRAQVEAMIARGMAGQSGWDFECRIRRTDGHIRWIWVAGRFHGNGSGPKRVAGVVQDITDRKTIEEENRQLLAAVQTEKDRLASLIDSITDEVWFADSQKRFTLANPSAIRTFGVDVTSNLAVEQLAANLEVFRTDGSPRPIDEAPPLRALRGEVVSNVEEIVRNPLTDELLHREVSANAVRDAQGEIIGAVAVVRNITDRKRAEEALAESELRYRILADSGQALIWTSGTDKKCDYFNKPWLAFTGRTLAQEVGDGWLEGVHPEDFDRCLHIYVTAFDKRQPFSMDYRLRHCSGDYRWIQDDGTPRFSRNGTFMGYIGHCLDISWRKHAEEEAKTLQAQLHQAQKMEAIGVLAGGIAHDFNNILGAITGYAEMVGEDIAPGTTTSEYLDKVLLASQRAASLVKQILAFSRQGNMQRIPLTPGPLVKEALKLLRPSLPATITIKQEIEGSTRSIVVDPTQFHQILMNLGTNAFHAMEQTGGTLTIILKDCELSGADLRKEPEVLPGTFVMLAVGDTGTGIRPEILEKIFDPYFTTKEFGKGTGMGLAIVHGIVVSSGGFITCESEIGKGTVFRIFFPAIDQTIVSAVEPDEDVPSGTERILFVDDEEMLADLGKAVLEQLGYQVTALTSSREALALFQHQPGRFDAVITDQTMADMTGIDLARRMLQLRADLPIILCTGHSTLISEEQVKAEGVKGFIMKPFVRSKLAQLLRAVLDQGAMGSGGNGG